jgi:hypothetical protein
MTMQDFQHKCKPETNNKAICKLLSIQYMIYAESVVVGVGQCSDQKLQKGNGWRYPGISGPTYCLTSRSPVVRALVYQPSGPGFDSWHVSFRKRWIFWWRFKTFNTNASPRQMTKQFASCFQFITWSMLSHLSWVCSKSMDALTKRGISDSAALRRLSWWKTAEMKIPSSLASNSCWYLETDLFYHLF